MFHVQSSSMSCRSEAPGGKPLGVIKKNFSGKSQKMIFWKTSHKRSNGLLSARKVKRYITLRKKTQQKNPRVALPGCDSWSSTLQPEEHRWAVSLLEECGGPEFTGNSITHATWLHGFQAAYVIAQAKHLFGSRKLLGSITIISNRCFSPWSILNHLGKVHFDPFWSFCVFLQLCFCVCNCFRDAHLHTVSYIACLIFLRRWQCSRSTWNHLLFAWAQAAKGPRQRLSKVQRHVHTIFKFLPAVPWLTYKGHTVWECEVLSVCLRPSYTVAYSHLQCFFPLLILQFCI